MAETNEASTIMEVDQGNDQPMSESMELFTQVEEQTGDQKGNDSVDPMDTELKAIHGIRQALSAQICMYEAVEKDIDRMNEQMDRLKAASQLCRERMQAERTDEPK